jgi:hypothetical protein
MMAAAMIATTRKTTAPIAGDSRRSIWSRSWSLRGVVRMAASTKVAFPYMASQALMFPRLRAPGHLPEAILTGW